MGLPWLPSLPQLPLQRKISFLAVLSADPLAHGRLGEAPLPSHFQGRNLAQGGPQPQSANRDPQPPAQLFGGEWPRGTP